MSSLQTAGGAGAGGAGSASGEVDRLGPSELSVISHVTFHGGPPFKLEAAHSEMYVTLTFWCSSMSWAMGVCVCVCVSFLRVPFAGWFTWELQGHHTF